MSLPCTRCSGTGFLNVEQVNGDMYEHEDPHQWVLGWIAAQTNEHDVQVCDCCGDGESWFGVPGEHYNSDDPPGQYGPYQSNGGLCHCH